MKNFIKSLKKTWVHEKKKISSTIHPQDSHPLSSTLDEDLVVKNKFYMEALEDLNNALYRDKNNFLALKWRAFCYYEIQVINANEDITKVFWFKNGNKAFAYGICGEINLDCGEFQDTINDVNKWNDSLKNLNLAIKTLLDNVATIRILINPKNLVIRKQSMNLHRRNCRYNVALGDAERQYNTSLADLDNAIRISPTKYYEDALNNVKRALEVKSADHYALEV
ncbi:hypothetical protein Glove_19g405 [Diversispora epigaea]|uniref:Uncharacterized protein n=1 Tax=Diversispora epigaea TaxID=1348612 RepID=A0A397JMA8_9GLOM|nr:hypothetical protein Glove_19g405 [Diversispora epigaea]